MTRPKPDEDEKPLLWAGSARKDYLQFPREVQRSIGLGLGAAQFGGKSRDAKPWKGEGPGVFELVEDFRGDTYRAIYTVRFRSAVYVLHAFQKKSPSGIRTDRRDVELIRSRLRWAQEDYEARFED